MSSDGNPSNRNALAERREFSERHALNVIAGALRVSGVSKEDWSRARTLSAFVEGGFLTEDSARGQWMAAGGDRKTFEGALYKPLSWVAVRPGEGDNHTVNVISGPWQIFGHPVATPLQALESWIRETNFRLRYWQGQMWRYSGGYYKPMEDGELRRILQHDLNLAVIVQNQVAPNGTVTQVSTGVRIGGFSVQRDVYPTLTNMVYRESSLAPESVLCFRNGNLDPVTGTVWPHTPKVFLISKVDADYDEDATCPNWERFVASSFPDPEQADLLQQICGYLLSGRQEQQKIFGFWGQPRSGKSTVLRVLERLMGEGSMSSPSLASLTGAHGLAASKNSRIIQIGEARFDRDNKSSIDILLRISGRDLVEVNPKGKPAFQARLPGRIVMVSNEQPNVLEDSGALANRFVHLSFEVSFLGNEDTALEDKLYRELPGIANWCLEGLRRLDEKGKFPETKKHLKLAKAQGVISNHAVLWFRDCVRPYSGATSFSEIRASYDEWCDAHDVEDNVRWSDNRLGRHLTGRGYDVVNLTVNRKSVKAREGMTCVPICASDDFSGSVLRERYIYITTENQNTVESVEHTPPPGDLSPLSESFDPDPERFDLEVWP